MELQQPPHEQPFSASVVVARSRIGKELQKEQRGALEVVEAAVQTSDLDSLIEQAQHDMDGVMGDLCSTAQVAWLKVRKRTQFQIALYYVFLSHALRHVWATLDTTSAQDAIAAFGGEISVPTQREHSDLIHWSLVVKFLTHFIPPAANMQLYMRLCSALASNCQKRWVTGSGQTQATAARVRLYETYCHQYEQTTPVPVGQPVREDPPLEEAFDGLDFLIGEFEQLDQVLTESEAANEFQTGQGCVTCDLDWMDSSQNSPLLHYYADDSLSPRSGTLSLSGSVASSPSNASNDFSFKRRREFEDLSDLKRHG